MTDAPGLGHGPRMPRARAQLQALCLWLLAVISTLLLHACASAPATRAPAHPAARAPAAAPAPLPAVANSVLFRAIGLVGTPYRYGGNTPEGGFDCSGLVGYVFRDAAGLSLPRRSSDIAGIDAPTVDRDGLAPGDLVFFGRRGINHVGIYVGEGRFVHAPSTGGTVRMDPLDGPYWRDNYAFAKRPL